MKTAQVAYFRSEEHDIWLGRRRDGVLVMEGFAKDGDDLKYLVDTPEDASLRTALESLKHYGSKVQRPYLLGDGCDGSITVPVMALYLDFCKRHEFDAATLYAEAYPGDKGLDEEAVTTFAEWQGVRIPHRWTAACFEGLLKSLTAVNCHMLRSVVEEAAIGITFPTGVLERGGYVAFRGNTRTYGPEARFTWGHVVTPTGEHYWRYDPWQSKNGVVPKHYWLSFIAVAAGQDGNLELKRQVLEEALSVARSPANKGHYAWWLGSLGLEAARELPSPGQLKKRSPTRPVRQKEVFMTAPQALLGFWSGKLALVLGPDTIVWLVNPADKQFKVEQHGQVIDEGRITALQAKRFTLAATGTREITRTTVDLNCLVGRAVA